MVKSVSLFTIMSIARSLSMLERMFNKRGLSYKAMRYHILFNSEAPEQGQLSTEFLLAFDKQGSQGPAQA